MPRPLPLASRRRLTGSCFSLHAHSWRRLDPQSKPRYTPTTPTEQSSSWEAKRPSASQENSTLWNSRAHYRVQMDPPPVHIRNQIYPSPGLTIPFLRCISISSSHLRQCLPSGLFPSGFPTKTLYMCLLSHIYSICPAHLILLDLTIRIIFGMEYR